MSYINSSKSELNAGRSLGSALMSAHERQMSGSRNVLWLSKGMKFHVFLEMCKTGQCHVNCRHLCAVKAPASHRSHFQYESAEKHMSVHLGFVFLVFVLEICAW